MSKSRPWEHGIFIQNTRQQRKNEKTWAISFPLCLRRKVFIIPQVLPLDYEQIRKEAID